MRVCYGILSSNTDGKIVAQLVDSLGKNSPIIVHHDFSQESSFFLSSDANVTVIDDYISTEWGRWSQAEAILSLLEYAVGNESFDYFQLLSETCLPIRPIEEFESFLEVTQPDACIGLIRIFGKSNDLGTLNYAWRYLVGDGAARRAMELLTRCCMEKSGKTDVRARLLVEGLSVVRSAEKQDVPELPLMHMLLDSLLALTSKGHPFNDRFSCFVGSTWFCLSRKVAEYILNELNLRRDLIAHYKNTLCPDESIIHTLVGNSRFKNIASINHYLSWKIRANGPDELSMVHLPEIRASKKFFARKLSKLTTSDLRRELINACS